MFDFILKLLQKGEKSRKSSNRTLSDDKLNKILDSIIQNLDGTEKGRQEVYFAIKHRLIAYLNDQYSIVNYFAILSDDKQQLLYKALEEKIYELTTTSVGFAKILKYMCAEVSQLYCASIVKKRDDLFSSVHCLTAALQSYARYYAPQETTLEKSLRVLELVGTRINNLVTNEIELDHLFGKHHDDFNYCSLSPTYTAVVFSICKYGNSNLQTMLLNYMNSYLQLGINKLKELKIDYENQPGSKLRITIRLEQYEKLLFEVERELKYVIDNQDKGISSEIITRITQQLYSLNQERTRLGIPLVPTYRDCHQFFSVTRDEPMSYNSREELSTGTPHLV